MRAKASYETWEAELTGEFGIRPAEALKRLSREKYTIKDIYSGRSLQKFATSVFYWARAYGETTNLQLLLRVYTAIHPELKQFCTVPTETDNLSDWIRKVEEKRHGVAERLRATGTRPDRQVIDLTEANAAYSPEGPQEAASEEEDGYFTR